MRRLRSGGNFGGTDLDGLRKHLLAGGVAAVPTESSYGLAAWAQSPAGVEQIYRLKARQRGKPLPVVIADREQAMRLGIDVDHPAFRWALSRWPAPLTVVVPLLSSHGELSPAAAGEETLAVRIPSFEPLRSLLSLLGFALTATSANSSGEPPCCDPAELERWLDEETWLVDGGRLGGGLPSTVVAWREGSGPEVLRPGAFALPSDRGSLADENPPP